MKVLINECLMCLLFPHNVFSHEKRPLTKEKSPQMMTKHDDFEERTLLTFPKWGLTRGLTTWPVIWQLSTHLSFLFFCFCSHPTPWTCLTLILGSEGTWCCCHWLLSLLVNSNHSHFVSSLQSINSSSQKAGWLPEALTLGLRYHVAREAFFMKRNEQTLASISPCHLQRKWFLKGRIILRCFIYIFLS